MDKQNIQELILKEHYGLLTPEEREELDMLLEHYEEVREMREEIRREVPVDEARGAIRQFNVEQNFENILAERAALLARRRKKWYWGASAAIVLLAAGITYFFLNPRQQQAPFVAANPDAIVLKLANGQTVTLNDSGRQQINLHHTVLNNQNRQLQFTAESGENTGWNTLSVPARKHYEIELADGTKVWLNSTSRIRFPFAFDGAVREIYIEGEAYFKVAGDAKRPFIVHSGITEVKVLGTEFNINAYLPGNIVTSLVKGRVAVHSEGEQVALAPGKEAVTRTGSGIKVQPFKEELLTWRQGIYYFENSTMPEIAAMVERWFDEKMIIDNQQVKEMKFRGKLYRDRDLQIFIEQLNETGLITIYRKNGVLHCK